jgi:response regulator of citrate/malate metabolism
MTTCTKDSHQLPAVTAAANDRASSNQLEAVLSGLSFLIVYDVMGTCKMVRELIKELGARADQISMCPSVLLAKQRLTISPVDVVISDLHLRDGKGLELLRNVRAHPQQKDSVFLIITGDPTSELVNESVDLGVSSVLVKPITFTNLREHLQFSLKRFLRLTDPPSAGEPPSPLKPVDKPQKVR